MGGRTGVDQYVQGASPSMEQRAGEGGGGGVWVAGTATGSSFSTLLLPLGRNIDPACHYCDFCCFSYPLLLLFSIFLRNGSVMTSTCIFAIEILSFSTFEFVEPRKEKFD